jgi:hypothetical protein
MSERTLVIGAAGVVALSLLLFLAPQVGIIIVALATLGVPALAFLDRNAFVRRHRMGPGASSPGERGYRGNVAIRAEGAADYDYRRRSS